MYIRASSGLGCRSVGVNLAERGQRRVEGPPSAGSNSDSIPMSIPTSSHYIECETKTTAIPSLLFCREREESFEEPAPRDSCNLLRAVHARDSAPLLCAPPYQKMEDDFSDHPFGSFRTRSPMMLCWISDDPAAIVRPRAAIVRCIQRPPSTVPIEPLSRVP
jgi:hypothetical protein